VNTAVCLLSFIFSPSTSITSSRANMAVKLSSKISRSLHCNRHKGPNIGGRDPVTGELIRLFHPRWDRWSEQFECVGSELAGKTAIGRITIQVLAVNATDFRAVREALMEERT
jgi:hypothetical protein